MQAGFAQQLIATLRDDVDRMCHDEFTDDVKRTSLQALTTSSDPREGASLGDRRTPFMEALSEKLVEWERSLLSNASPPQGKVENKLEQVGAPVTRDALVGRHFFRPSLVEGVPTQLLLKQEAGSNPTNGEQEEGSIHLHQWLLAPADDDAVAATIEHLDSVAQGEAEQSKQNVGRRLQLRRTATPVAPSVAKRTRTESTTKRIGLPHYMAGFATECNPADVALGFYEILGASLQRRQHNGDENDGSLLVGVDDFWDYRRHHQHARSHCQEVTVGVVTTVCTSTPKTVVTGAGKGDNQSLQERAKKIIGSTKNTKLSKSLVDAVAAMENSHLIPYNSHDHVPVLEATMNNTTTYSFQLGGSLLTTYSVTVADDDDGVDALNGIENSTDHNICTGASLYARGASIWRSTASQFQ